MNYNIKKDTAAEVSKIKKKSITIRGPAIQFPAYTNKVKKYNLMPTGQLISKSVCMLQFKCNIK